MNKRIALKFAVMSFVIGLWLSLGGEAAFAQSNMVVNGSFEYGAGIENFPGWDLVGPASNHSDYGVITTNIFPDVPEQGTNCAFFHGHPTDSSQDCLGQTVYLTVGAQYNISYYLATDGTTLGSGAAMWVVIGTSFGIDLSQDAMLTAYLPNTSAAIPYQKFSNSYTATQSTVILSFHAIDATSSILLDNVSLTPVLPQLNLTRSSSNTLVFNWNAWTNGFRMQTNTSLLTTNWVMLSNIPVTSMASNELILPAPVGTIFYRLKLP